MEKIIEKLEGMTAGQVWEIIWNLKDKLDDASDLVFTSALEVLERKVPEEKFLELMGKL